VTVYFLRAGDTDMVKIGWTNGLVEHRVAMMQPGCWETLQIIRAVAGNRAVESWLHKRFAHCRIEREWFRFDADMLTVKPQVMDPGREISWLDRLKTQPCLAYVARALCVPERSIARWAQVPEEYLDEVCRLTRTGKWFYRPDLFAVPWQKPRRGTL